MAGKFLIDVTDARFLIPANDDVIGFIRRANPFAHSDVGSVLLELGRDTPGAQAYCPSYGSCAYVVLHTDQHRIFAIAFGQRGLAFRLGAAARADALQDHGEPATAIGAEWIQLSPWDVPGITGAADRLQRWCARALADAMGA